MKQYKHTQSSDIVESLNNGYYINIHTKTTIPGKYIENTNDWVEILSKPEYTILTLVSDITKIVLCSFDKHEENGVYGNGALMSDCYENRDEWLKAFLRHSFWNIHSVRRENDGLILTVGDNTPTGIIKSFILKENTVGYASGEHTSWVGLKVWRKIQLKEWEITSLTSPYGPVPLLNPANFEYLLNKNKNYIIRSIKRLSDNVQFKIGDKVDSTISDLGRPTDLTGFKVIDNKLTVGLKDLGYYPLSTIILPKKPLFTTEDGVDIFDKETLIFEVVLLTLNLNKDMPLRMANSFFYDKNLYPSKVFSTKEAAEEYILMNKPCLSLNDIYQSNNTCADFPINFQNKILQLVKTKL